MIVPLDRSYSIEADVTIPSGGANGVIVACGGVTGGYSLFVQNGRPAFTYNLIQLAMFRWKGAAAMTPGHHVITFSFMYDGGGYGKGGTGTLMVDGKSVDSHSIPKSVPFTFPWFEGLDIGQDSLTPVDSSYQSPFPFTGSIAKITYTLQAPKMTAAQWKRYHEVLHQAALGVQ